MTYLPFSLPLDEAISVSGSFGGGQMGLVGGCQMGLFGGGEVGILVKGMLLI